MFYRAIIDLAYPDDLNPQEIIARTIPLRAKAIVINPHTENEERGYITLQECYHDEDPTKPCLVIDNWQVPY